MPIRNKVVGLYFATHIVILNCSEDGAGKCDEPSNMDTALGTSYGPLLLIIWIVDVVVMYHYIYDPDRKSVV